MRAAWIGALALGCMAGAGAAMPPCAAGQATGLGPGGPRLSAPPTRGPGESPDARTTPAAPDRSATPTPSPLPEPSPAFGRVVYRARKVGSFESLGIIVIRCRHRDPAARRIAIEIFDPLGKPVSTFGPTSVAALPPGKKVTFVSDGRYFRERPDLIADMRVAHLSRGTLRVVSDAAVIRCQGRLRFDGGWGYPTAYRGIGFVREGSAKATPVPDDW